MTLNIFARCVEQPPLPLPTDALINNCSFAIDHMKSQT